MTYHAQINLIMLVTVLGLAIFLYLTPRFKSDTDETIQISLRSPETVRSIRIVRNDQTTVLQRDTGDWRLVAPVIARVDAASVGNLLNVLSANSRQRFSLQEAESYNLDQPLIELYIDNDYFAFGGLAPVTNEQYLAINNAVYLVSPRYAMWIPVNYSDLISSHLLSSNEVPVRFELSETAEVVQRDGMWHWNTEKTDSLNDQELARWVEIWRNYQTTDFLMGLPDDFDHVTKVKIKLQNGDQIDFNVVERGADIIFYRIDEQVGYQVPEPIGRQLLDPFAAVAAHPE